MAAQAAAKARPPASQAFQLGVVVGGGVDRVVGLVVGLAVDLAARPDAAGVEADEVEPGAGLLREEQRAQLVQDA